MIASEVLKHYEEGGKIRCKDWRKGHYIIKCYGDKLTGMYREDVIIDTWEIYQEPKKRLLTAKELFERGAVAITELCGRYIFITELRDNAIITHGGTSQHISHYEKLGYKWTADRKTWHDFYTSDNEK